MADEGLRPDQQYAVSPQDDPLVVAMLAAERLRGMEIERQRHARVDGPLVRVARRVERALALRV